MYCSLSLILVTEWTKRRRHGFSSLSSRPKKKEKERVLVLRPCMESLPKVAVLYRLIPLLDKALSFQYISRELSGPRKCSSRRTRTAWRRGTEKLSCSQKTSRNSAH